jgi:hypothetical protein
MAADWAHMMPIKGWPPAQLKDAALIRGESV